MWPMGSAVEVTRPMESYTWEVFSPRAVVALSRLPLGKGRLVGLTNKDGTEVAVTYDANGNVLTVTDEEGSW